MKTKSIIVLILILLSANLNANTNKLALELARSKNLSTVIQRTNIVHEFINLFALQEGRLPNNMAALILKYPGLSIKGFRNSSTIEFIISNNLVNYTNVVPTTVSPLIRQIYINSTNLSANAIVNNLDLSMNITLNPKTIQFLSYVDELNEINIPGDYFISSTSPTCNSTNEGKLWYKPNSNGGFIISFCEIIAPNATWEFISNRLNIVILRDTKTKLDAIKPQTGTIGYVKNTATTAKQYIFSTNTWLEINN